MQAKILLSKSINEDIETYTKAIRVSRKNSEPYSRELWLKINNITLDVLEVKISKTINMEPGDVATLQPGTSIRIGSRRCKVKEQVFDLASETMEIQLEKGGMGGIPIAVALPDLLKYSSFEIKVEKMGDNLKLAAGNTNTESFVASHIRNLYILYKDIMKAYDAWEEEHDEDGEAA